MSAMVEQVVGLIRHHRIDLSDEKAAQAQIQALLEAHGVNHEREVRLSPRDVPDFLIPPGLALEVKLRTSSKMDIFRQLERYAKHDRVQAILLASNLAMTLPGTIGGKPAFMVSLGSAWL